MNKTYSLVEMFLTETSIEDLKSQWVETGKMNPEQFDTICKAANNKSSWVTWFGKRILDRQLSLKPEDISKWQEIINLFERYKQRFTYKDINQVKTRDQISQFVDQALDLKSQAQSKDLATKAAKDQFAEFYRGSVDIEGKQFKVYVLPKGRKDLYKVSRAIAGDTGWCTASSDPDYFQNYIRRGDLIILINSADPKEKYQLHSDGDFMDRTDEPVMFSNPKFKEAALNVLFGKKKPVKGVKPIVDFGWKVVDSRVYIRPDDVSIVSLIKKYFGIQKEKITIVSSDDNVVDRSEKEWTDYLNVVLKKGEDDLIIVEELEGSGGASLSWFIKREPGTKTTFLVSLVSDEAENRKEIEDDWYQNCPYSRLESKSLLYGLTEMGAYSNLVPNFAETRKFTAANLKLNEPFNPNQKQRLQYLAGLLS